MSGAHQMHGGLVPGGHTSETAGRRAAAIAKIRELLAEKPMTNLELAVKLDQPARTVYGYLCHLQDMGEAYQMDGTDGRGRKTWAMDEDAQKVAAHRAADEHSKRAWIVPARQMGMPRDPLVAALFGPALAHPMIQQGQ